MSGIFGIVDQEQRRISPSHLNTMAASMALRGPDGTNTICRDHLGFGHCMLCSTPESLTEQLPYTDTESGLSITCDARIDNRQDLKNSIGLPSTGEITDSQLILHAFKKWGTESFSHLIGDFSVAIWESATKRLTCARDFVGVRPFYYHHSNTKFSFSSEIKQLATQPDIPLVANEGMAAEYLASSFCSRTETLFFNINRLPAGHYLTLIDNTIQIYQYWECIPKFRTYYKKSSDYTEHFLEIFEKSVKDRLRCQDPVCFELSGGLDSSCVVGMANTILRARNVPPPKAYSLIFPGLACDESKYIEAALSHNQISPHFINPLEDSCLNAGSSRGDFMPCDVPNLAITTPLFNAIKSEESRVILSGIGGDQCFTGSDFPYLDHLTHFKMKLFFKEFQWNFRKRGITTTKKVLLSMVWPLLSKSLRGYLTKINTSRKIPPWFTEDFIKISQIKDRIHHADPRNAISNLGQVFHKMAFGPTEQWALEKIDIHRSALQIESRHPFLDKRIVDFSLSLPSFDNRQTGKIKLPLRSPNNTLLPDIIRTRQDKAEFSYLINTILKNSLFTQNPSEFSICKNGWIDPNTLQDAISLKANSVKKDPHSSGNDTWSLWFAYSINMWYGETIPTNNTVNIGGCLEDFKQRKTPNSK